MKIYFVLPMITNNPSGGYKVVYEYANRLSKRKHDVHIVYYCMILKKYIFMPKIIQKLLRVVISQIRFKLFGYPKWFKLHKNIRTHITYGQLNEVEPSDIIIATSFHTTAVVKNTKSDNKFYLIQGYENWYGVTNEEVNASYKLGMKNIVIASWLKKIVDSVLNNKESVVLYNGINGDEFYKTKEITKRKKHSLAMLYHKDKHKGSSYGIKVIRKLRQKYPDLSVELFGTCKFEAVGMEYVHYTRNANIDTLRHIYNSSRVYIYPTIKEGFGLTCVEAMACGCALCVTDYDGARDFAENNVTALISPVRDVDKMVDAVINVFENDELATILSKNAILRVKKYNWDTSTTKFEKMLFDSFKGFRYDK